MAKDGYAWWKARFTKMAEYFDAYRIDHILGFFRIWEIPDTAVEGLPGHFNAALPFTPDDLARYDFAFDEEAPCQAIHSEIYASRNLRDLCRRGPSKILETDRQ